MPYPRRGWEGVPTGEDVRGVGEINVIFDDKIRCFEISKVEGEGEERKKR